MKTTKLPKLTIVEIASEAVPFAKTGGLADVVGTLPKELATLGHTLIRILPKYGTINEKLFDLKEVLRLKIDSHEGERTIIIKYCSTDNVHNYFVEYNPYFDRSKLYGDQLGDYPDNLARFTMFSQACLELLKKLELKPDIIHCHDWQTALIPVYIKVLFNYDPLFMRTKVIYTIHNMAYQGTFHYSQWRILQLPIRLWRPEYLEFWGNINLMKGGIIFSDAITTVSPTYAKEIQTTKYGYGLDGLISSHKQKLTGIINGIDYTVWNPVQDNYLYGFKFDERKIENKELIKKNFFKEIKLSYKSNIPLIGMISRLADQKGLDILIDVLNILLRKKKICFVILGSGDAYYHNLLLSMQKKFPDNMYVNLKFDEEFAHKIEAASDIFVMPSKFEPCGLSQLISLKYGTVPVVRTTGGLSDTIKNGINGFSFSEYSTESFLVSINQAIATYTNEKEKWKKIQKYGMKQDWSWKSSAKRYEKVFSRLTDELLNFVNLHE